MKDLFQINRERVAGIDPQMRYKEGDFYLWQKNSRIRLSQLLGISDFRKCEDRFEIKEECNMGEYTHIKFVFQSEEGVFIPCDMLVPKTGKNSYPLMICLQGHTTGRHMSVGTAKFPGDSEGLKQRPERAIALESVKRGYIAVAMEQRYMGELGQNEDGKPVCRRAMPVLLTGRTVIGERVWDVMRLIDAVEKNVSIADMEKISCMGGSGGGTTTFYAACLDERIKCVLPNVSICTYESSIVAVPHCFCNYIPGIAKYFDMGDLGGLIAPRRMVISSGADDKIFPVEGARKTAELIRKLYSYAGAEENFDFYIGEGGHQAYTEDVFKILGK